MKTVVASKPKRDATSGVGPNYIEKIIKKKKACNWLYTLILFQGFFVK